jgi:hypothetical protein
MKDMVKEFLKFKYLYYFLPLILIFSKIAIAHIANDSGKTLQLISYKMSGPAPTIDGDIATTNPTEWKEAYNRKIVLTDDGLTSTNDTATLLLMNDDNYLYIALAYEHDNTGVPNRVYFYFDEGASGGSHDDLLSAGHENAVSCGIGINQFRQDMYWNGTSWAVDGDGEIDFNSGWGFSAQINNIEMRIPLNNGKTDNATNSDLNVSSTDEIGFYFKIFKNGAKTVTWSMFPALDENVVSNYADIQLGVKRTFSTLYASYKALATTPNLSNGITGDDAWRGCYQRDIILTNFMGSTLKATLYLIDDVNAKNIYAGIKIADEYNSSDYISIYQEQKQTTNDTYDAILNGNAENCLQLTANNNFTDRYFKAPTENAAPGTWEIDPEPADNNAGAVFYNSSTNTHEFEFRIDRNAGNYDLTLNNGANCQFLIEYYDADAPAGERLYYWSNSTDNVQIRADQTNSPPIRSAIGWAVLQLGAPYSQVICPVDGSNVEGIVHVRIYVENSGNSTADSVRFYRIGSSGIYYPLTRIASTFEWTGSYDVSSLPNNTKDTLVFEIFNGSIKMERLVTVNVSNGTGAVTSPVISNILPVPGSEISGTQRITFNIDAGTGTLVDTLISVDGNDFVKTTTKSYYDLATNLLADGSHTIQLKAINSSGAVTTSQIITYIVRNSPSVVITSPRADSTVSDTINITFTATAVSPANIASTWISVDGGTYISTTTLNNHLLATGELSDGSHIIRIKAIDNYNKEGFSEILKINTSNSPHVSITTPKEDSIVSGSVTVNFVVTTISSASIQLTQISIDGGAWIQTTSSTYHMLDTRKLSEGSHLIQIRATDSNGKIGTSSIIKIVVRNQPAVTIISPRPDSVVSGTVVIKFTAVPVAPATIASTQISVDGGAFRPTSTDSTDTLDTQKFTDGDHIIQIKVTDSNNKSAISQIVKFVIRNSPFVSIISPRPDSVISGKVEIRFSAVSVYPAVIAKREIFIDGAYYDTSTTDSTYLWNTITISDGTHSIMVRVTDSNGKKAESQNILVKTFNTPIVTITAPSETLLLSGIDTIKFTVAYAPNTSRDTTEISFNGGAWIPTTTPESYVWITTNFADNSHTVQIRAKGTNGKTGYSQIMHYRVNNTPRVVVTEPVSGEIVSGIDTVCFIASAVSPSVIVKREISIDGDKFTDSLVDTASRIINTIDLADGTHSVQIKVTDDHGRAGYSQQVLFITKNSPSVSIVLPEASDTLNDTILVKFKADAVSPAKIDSCFISVDGGKYVLTSNDSIAYINSKALADGSHIFTIKVKDNKGKIAQSESRLFVVDNSPPILASPVIIYPQDTYLAKSGTKILLTCLVKDIIAGIAEDSGVVVFSDSIGLSLVRLVMNDNGIDGDKISGDNVYTATIIVESDSSGPIPYTITAKDKLGNVSKISSNIVLDNIPPKTSFSLYSLLDTSKISNEDTVFREAVIVKGSYLDKGGSQLLRVFLSVIDDSGKYVGNSPVVLSTKDSLFSLIVPLVTGGNTIMLFAEDRAGNKDSTTVKIVNLDLKEPKAIYTLTPSPEYVTLSNIKAVYVDKIIMKGKYSDAGGSGLSRVYISLTNDSLLHVNNSPIELSTKDSLFSRILNLVPGKNIISMTALDRCGNKITIIDSIMYYEPKQTALINKSGGSVKSPDGATVSIPEDALLTPLEITITKVDPLDERKPIDSSITLLNVAHDFGPNGTIFRKPVRITLTYTEADLDRDQNGIRDIDPLKLSLVVWDGKTWREVGGSVVDTVIRCVTAEVNHFTIYDIAQIMSQPPSQLKAYWTKNPVSYSEGSTFVFELPEKGTVGLSIFDVSGNLVYQIIKNGTAFEAGKHDGIFMWRGENVSGRFSGAGLYVYVFSYTSNSGKKTVIRKPLGLVR